MITETPFSYNEELRYQLDSQEEIIDWELINRADDDYIRLVDSSMDMGIKDRPVVAQAIHELRLAQKQGSSVDITTELIKERATEIQMLRAKFLKDTSTKLRESTLISEFNKTYAEGDKEEAAAAKRFFARLSANTENPSEPDVLQEDSLSSLDIEPFQQYIESDKSIYRKASEVINPKTNRFYVDTYDYFLVDSNGAFLLNIDFKFTNTHKFLKAAAIYKKTGKYTAYKRDSVAYTSFRKKEEHRRKVGLTAPCRLNKDGSVTDLHITGEFYNFLNYGRVQILDEGALKSNINIEATKSFDFPKFIDFQFWYTWVKKFARANGFNLITLKSRRKGASFMEGIDTASILNLHPDKVVIHAAGDKKYITVAGAITPMSYRQLRFYEEKTPFIRGAVNKDGTSKGLLSTKIEELVLGFKYKNRLLGGWLSTLFSLSTRNEPGAAVGKDAIAIKCDELNDFPNFSDFMSVTNPTITSGAFKTGIISAFGTGGVKAGNWAEFEKNYYETKIYDFMPFSNVWDKDSQAEVIGLFLPYWWGLQGVNKDGVWAMDEQGNTIYQIAKEISVNERRLKKLDTGIGRDYIMHCSQYANRPSEAFNSGTETVLTSLELKEYIKRLKIDKGNHFYSDGMIIDDEKGKSFRTNDWLDASNYETHPYITKVPFNANEDFAGCLRIYHRPYMIEDKIPDGLYFSVYDPVGSEIVGNEIQDRHSLASIQVWMASNNITNSNGKILVASWIGRRDTQLEMDQILFDITEYYNGKVLAEMDRGNVKANAKQLKKTHLLLPDPTELVLNRKVRNTNNTSYGMIIGKGNRKTDGIDYLKDFLYETLSVDENGRKLRRFHYIKDLEFLIEVDKFRLKGNFDRISTAILAVYQFNANDALKRKPKTKAKNKGNNLQSKLLKH